MTQIKRLNRFNLLLIGPPGEGKSLIAKALPRILPRLSPEEKVELTRIYSATGKLKNDGMAITRRPLRSVHHGTSMSALIGGGSGVPTLVEQSENTIKNVAPEGSVHKNSQEPKFTFRVVGDHVGDRSYWINKLRNAENLQFAREPSNPHDQNAVAVCNKSGKQLGYLKREVAAWFARLLDDGKQYSVSVLRVRSDGSLIVAVFD